MANIGSGDCEEGMAFEHRFVVFFIYFRQHEACGQHLLPSLRNESIGICGRWKQKSPLMKQLENFLPIRFDWQQAQNVSFRKFLHFSKNACVCVCVCAYVPCITKITPYNHFYYVSRMSHAERGDRLPYSQHCRYTFLSLFALFSFICSVIPWCLFEWLHFVWLESNALGVLVWSRETYKNDSLIHGVVILQFRFRTLSTEHFLVMCSMNHS